MRRFTSFDESVPVSHPHGQFMTTHRTGQPLRGHDPLATSMPLVGRTVELAALEALVEHSERDISLVLLSGEGGVGKSRLVSELAERVEGRGWTVARGRAYPVEMGVPYALFSDAFLPILRAMDEDTLTVLSRGGEAELAYLFPTLTVGDRSVEAAEPGGDPEEFRTRILWNFAEFLARYAAREPLLVILEDLHWADDSSLRLLHFLARQAIGQPLLFLATYNSAERDGNAQLVQAERSLVSMRAAEQRRLDPLDREQLTELVCRVFGTEADFVAPFATFLFEWTRGNPFFTEEVLKSLVGSGALTFRDGRWTGWDARDIDLPGSIRDAVLGRVASCSPGAQKVADVAAVVGSRAGYPLLARVVQLEEAELLEALDDLCAHGILDESEAEGTVVYGFVHPVVREILYAEFGLQRARLLHGQVAEAMEAQWGDDAMAHADELAYHFARSDAGHLADKAVRYLAAAGKAALARHADREAVNYLRAALERYGRMTDGDGRARLPLVTDLARGHLRLGEYEVSVALWIDALGEVEPGGTEEAGIRQSLGLAHLWCGRHREAMEQLDAGLRAAEGDPAATVRTRLIRAHCLQELGRGHEARSEIEAALPVARDLGAARLQARAHRALALLHVWMGPPDAARAHAERAIELARASDDPSVEFWARWGMAVQFGMRGDTASLAPAIQDARALADRLRSPVLKLWTAELTIELAHATGDWDTGLTLGEQAIALARKLNQRVLLPRLLVWTSLFYVGRGRLERAEELVAEASEISGLRRTSGPLDVHLVVPAYIGLAHYQVALGDYHDAIESARKGLAIAEGTGYVLWAIHRLLPIYAEASLWAGEIELAAELGDRMREHAQALDHPLGIAWADACDALVAWKRGDSEQGAVLMRQAADRLEEIPMIPYAARIRRQLAGRLAEIGDVEGSVEELRKVHDVFVRIGAELELEKARMQFREVGHRPPPRGAGEGIAGLTARELEIALLVARRKSNKAIGKELGISPRTASTHLSNIFQKLDIASRGELADVIRSEGLLD